MPNKRTRRRPPPDTATAPKYELPPTLPSPGLITAIRAYGCPGEHPLSTKEATFSVGSSSGCDVRIASEYVSSHHCHLLRRERHLRVRDLDSRNGIYFRGHRETEFEVAPGDLFNVATTQLFALNDVMRIARHVLTDVIGHDREDAIDDVLMEAVLDRPILVVGPRGAGQSDLVRAIHDISIRRNQPLVEAADPPSTPEEEQQLIDDAQRGTLVLTANGRAFDETFLDAAFSSGRARVVLLAPSLQMAVRSITLNRFTFMGRIGIRPLRERPGEIPKLLDLYLARNGSTARWADLTPENRERLLHHHWPDNLRELRKVAAVIAALASQIPLRQAADVVKMPRTTMQYHINRFQLTVPSKASASPSSLECPTI